MNVGLAVVVALLLVGCRSSEDAVAWQAGPSLALPLAAGADALQSRQAQDADAERAIAALADQQRALIVVKAELRRRVSAPSLARFSGLRAYRLFNGFLVCGFVHVQGEPGDAPFSSVVGMDGQVDRADTHFNAGGEDVLAAMVSCRLGRQRSDDPGNARDLQAWEKARASSAGNNQLAVAAMPLVIARLKFLADVRRETRRRMQGLKQSWVRVSLPVHPARSIVQVPEQNQETRR